MVAPVIYSPKLEGLTWNYQRRNIVYCADWLDVAKSLPDKSVNLIIADPPYFEVKGDFDFVWDSFEAYLSDVERWAVECKRILADNGSLYWWGHAKKIAYSQVILDKYFCLLNANVWYKTDCKTRHGKDQFRSFAPVTERCLFYSTGKEPGEWDQTGWEKVKLDIANFQPLRDYFKKYQAALGITKKEIIDRLGQRADHCFRWGSSQWDMPTSETYEDLGKIPFKYDFVRKEYEDLRKEYEDLRKEYEDLRRPFYPQGFDDVWFFAQQVHITGQYSHKTQKPEISARMIIETSSRPGDLVFVPFAGSGTECAMAIKLGREVIGAEIDSYHCQTSNMRVSKAKAGMQPRTEAEVKAAGGQMALFDEL